MAATEVKMGSWRVFRLRGLVSALKRRKFLARRITDDEWAVVEERPSKRGPSITQRIVSATDFDKTFVSVE